MKLKAIREEVIRLVEDKGYDSITIDSWVNMALQECADKVDVPEFKRIFTVETATDVGYVSLKEKITGYGGRVKKVRYDGSDLRRYVSLDEMLIDFDDLETAGDIEAFCMEGRLLWYAKIPETAVNLLVLAYINPEPLSRSNEEADWMPENCQYKILVGGACAKIFDEKEEEDSGKPVTRRYEKMVEEGYVDLKSWISRNRVNLTYSCWTV